MANGTPNSREIQAAFAEYDRQETISNFKVACVIGMTLMPAGVVLDSFVYPDSGASIPQTAVPEFRCSLALFLALLLTPLGRRHYRFLGITLFMLPASFIAWMIYATEGAGLALLCRPEPGLAGSGFRVALDLPRKPLRRRPGPRALSGRGLFHSRPDRTGRSAACSSTISTSSC